MADQVLQVSDLLTIPGAAFITWLIVQATKDPLPITPRWHALYAIGVGVMVTLGAIFALGTMDRLSVATAVLIGVQAGALAVAGNEVAKGLLARAVPRG
jgi:uncharacterized membrane protein